MSIAVPSEQGRPHRPRAAGGRRLLLGQLVANGDCLYATAIARQIKHDEPDCHLTWAISAACRRVLEQNPHVDAVWEVPAFRTEDGLKAWRAFEREARARCRAGEFDEAYFLQLAPANLHRFDGNIRSSLFRGYPRPITVPVAPVVQLSAAEIENVRAWADRHRLAERSEVILFECAPQSGQSFVTPAFALEVARAYLSDRPLAGVILSSNVPLDAADSAGGGIVDGSTLSFRENAEITKYCSLLVGCSSGISWLCTSTWAKPLPNLQLHKADATWRNSFVRDHARWGLPTDGLLEMTDCSSARVVECLRTIAEQGFPAARARFHEALPANFRAYEASLALLLSQRAFGRVLPFLARTVGAGELSWRDLGRLAGCLGRYGTYLANRVVFRWRKRAKR